MWALDVGSCTQASQVHVSTDGGASWTSHDGPGGLTRVRPGGSTSAFVVGGDDRCRFRLWNTGDTGATWTAPQSAAAAWGRDPADATLLHRPGGDPVTPCAGDAEVADLTGLNGGAASVVCTDGTLRSTADTGTTWRTTLTVDGLSALSLSGPRTGVLAAVTPGCAGVQLVPVADGNAGKARCVADAVGAPGRVSLSVGGGSTWLLAGDVVVRGDSDDVTTATFAVAGSWPGS